MSDREPREFSADDADDADDEAANEAHFESEPEPVGPPEAANSEETPLASPYGTMLARAISTHGFHPVVIFGTTNSGKTHVLLSLFDTLQSEHRVEIKIDLSDKPLITSDDDLGARLHAEAKNLFEAKTAAFGRGEVIPNTVAVNKLPFFVPLEFDPIDAEKPNVKFALMESDGEWYRPEYDPKKPIGDLPGIYKPLRDDLEQFIRTYQGAISFIYLLPYTVDKVYSASDNSHEKAFAGSAEDAIVGVIKAYERCRKQFLGRDKHLLLLTKWDAHGQGKLNDVDLLREDRPELERQLTEKYRKALTAFKNLNVNEDQLAMRAYCAGLIGPEGARDVKRDSLSYRLITKYHVDLAAWLYRNAQAAADLEPVPLFRQREKVGFFRQLLSQLFGSKR